MLTMRVGHRRVAIVLLALPLLVGGACQRQDTRRSAEPNGSAPPAIAVAEKDLPLAGTEIPLLPPGDARDLAQTHCLPCHASEMILQQRLTGMQWRAEVDKMQRWGAEIRDEDKPALVLYLASRFGPDNDRFFPIVVQRIVSTQGSATTPER